MNIEYNNVEEKDVDYLASVVGKKYVTANHAICASYLSKSVMGLESQIGEAVVRPRYTEEVRKILTWCSARKIPVSPLSAGLSGGFACPVIKPGGIVLDLSRMNRILEVGLNLTTLSI